MRRSTDVCMALHHNAPWDVKPSCRHGSIEPHRIAQRSRFRETEADALPWFQRGGIRDVNESKPSIAVDLSFKGIKKDDLNCAIAFVDPSNFVVLMNGDVQV